MRKRPKQKRSKQLVDRLLIATADTVAEIGLDNTTTNHIAERAGVSIGSLYQYFPDKESLIEGMMEKISRDLQNAFRAQVDGVDFTNLPLKQVAKTAIGFGLAYIKNDPLAIEIITHWNRLPIEKILDPLEKFFLVMAQPYFISNYRNYPIENLEAKLYVLINSTLFSSVHYLYQEHQPIQEEVFIETLCEMIVSLLEPK